MNDFLRALAVAAEQPVKVFLTGGASAVLVGWRPSTIDIDLRIAPESDRMLKEIPSCIDSRQSNLMHCDGTLRSCLEKGAPTNASTR